MIRLGATLFGGVAVLMLAAGAGAKDTGYLFVSSEKDNAVYVLDGRTHALVKTIGTAARPRHLQFDRTRERIFVAAGDGDAIDIIDVGSLSLVNRIAGIDDPELFDISPDGRTLYISLEDDAKLGILDLEAHFAEREGRPDLTILEPAADNDGVVAGMTTIAVGEEPEGILASPDGLTVYVASEVANIVHVVDVASGTIRANVVAGHRPRRFQLTPDGRELWVSNELSASVTVIDPATATVIDTLVFEPPTGARPEEVTPVGIAMTADGATAVVALGRANHVAFVDVARHEIQDYVLVGRRAWNMTLSRDGARLYVVNGLSDDITVVDMESRRPLTSVRVGRVPHSILIDD